jgi:hypothetical protein
MRSERERFSVEPDYEIAQGCRCCSCWEPTGKWLVCDIEDKIEDLVFETKEEAISWIKNNSNQETFNESY